MEIRSEFNLFRARGLGAKLVGVEGNRVIREILV
jgi:hypothetical protein